MAPISIGEIHVPGGSGLAAARCLTLTSPIQQEGGLELFFAMLAADAPRRVVEKMSDRLGQELRPVFFQKGDPETRFEAALKQANKTILAFLYEHGLSLPGIKLRGAAAALSDEKLFVSSRGAMRGSLYMPHDDGLAPYALFDETPEKITEPKFFTSLQAGAFPDGARFVIATSELFQSLDDGYVHQTLGQSDFAKASREIKSALRASSNAVSILSLSSLQPEGAAAPVKSVSAKKQSSAKTARIAPPVVSPDIGEMGSRALRAGLLFVGRGIAAFGRGLWSLVVSVARLPAKLPRLFAILVDRERRARLIAECKAAPDRCASAIVGRLNALPHQSRMQLFILMAVSAIFVHGLLFSVRHEVRAQTAKAYEAQLAELQQLETDFEAGMIYDNENRTRELAARMDAVWNALPETTDAQKKTKTEARQGIERAKEKLRRVTMIEKPNLFATVNQADDALTAMSWFGNKLYVFSSASGRVRVISEEGSAASDPVIAALPTGVVRVVTARTGFLLQGASGTLVYWNPDTAEESAYDAGNVSNAPMLFYQGRLYAASADGTVTRRSVATKTLGSPSDVLRGAPASPTSIATDGAVYLLYQDGSTRKYLKGASVQDYTPSAIDPAPARATQAWVSPNSDKLVFIDQGGERAYEVDRTTGRLIAQLTSPKFKNLRAAAVDDAGRDLYLLNGDGMIYAIPLK